MAGRSGPRAWQVRPGLAIAPSLRVGYAREVLDNTRPITAILTGVGGAFTVTGDAGGRDFVTYGAGVQAMRSQGITLYAAYAGEWARDRNANSFTGVIRISW